MRRRHSFVSLVRPEKEKGRIRVSQSDGDIAGNVYINEYRRSFVYSDLVSDLLNCVEQDKGTKRDDDAVKPFTIERSLWNESDPNIELHDEAADNNKALKAMLIKYKTSSKERNELLEKITPMYNMLKLDNSDLSTPVCDIVGQAITCMCICVMTAAGLDYIHSNMMKHQGALGENRAVILGGAFTGLAFAALEQNALEGGRVELRARNLRKIAFEGIKIVFEKQGIEFDEKAKQHSR